MGSTGSSAWLVWVVVSSRTCAVATLLCRPRSLASAPLPKHPTITMQRLNWTMTCDRPLQLGCNATQQSQGTTSGGQILMKRPLQLHPAASVPLYDSVCYCVTLFSVCRVYMSVCRA